MSIINSYNSWEFWLQLILVTCALVGLFLLIYFLFKKQILAWIANASISLALFLFMMFGLTTAFIFCACLYSVYLVILFIVYPESFKKIVSLPLANGKKRVKRVYDRQSLYETINTTVDYLCKHKIGALITFEGKVSLESVMKSGTLLDCAVSPELIETIFYPGSRLHDGALIIRDDRIVAASVYYQPTNKPLTGKYGSRHRAAIGISEITDSVTVIVSEETGRISIAVNGELESVALDNFLELFTGYIKPISKISEGDEEDV